MTLPRGRVLKASTNFVGDVVELWGAETRAGRLVKRVVVEAEQRARAIVAEAENQARERREQAREDGQRAAEASLAAAWVKLRTEEARRDERDLDRAIDLARAMAERLVGESLALAPHQVVSMARQTLAFARQARRVVLRAHPADAESLKREIVSLGLEDAAIQIHADPDRSRGSLLVDTDLGTLDANLTVQLDRLARSLRDSLR
jgi:flagellar biosynthesis/type III secretory pathway protein FliH